MIHDYLKSYYAFGGRVTDRFFDWRPRGNHALKGATFLFAIAPLFAVGLLLRPLYSLTRPR